MAVLCVSSGPNSSLGDEYEFLNAVRRVDKNARVRRSSANEVIITCQNSLGLRMLGAVEHCPYVGHVHLESNPSVPFTDRALGQSGDRQEARQRRATVEVGSVTILTL